MHTITVSPAASTGLAIAVLTTATAVLAGAISRIVLSLLAVAAARKVLEDPGAGQADAGAIRAHRLAVLMAILAALSPCRASSRLDHRWTFPSALSPSVSGGVRRHLRGRDRRA